MKTTLTLFIVLFYFSLVSGQNQENKICTLLIGTYTSSSQNDGIYNYDFNMQTGDFNLKSKVSGVENPSYLAISRNGQHVYAVNEIKNGGISAFNFNQTSGKLVLLNQVSSGGDSPCYIAVDDHDKFVFAGNYGSGSLSAVALKEDGSLSSNIQFIQQEGSSIDKSRQQGPHVHATVITPDNHYLLTPNLGTDKVSIYRIDLASMSKPLSPAEPPYISVKPGSGPRHITFHSNSKYVYLIHEMAGMITAFDYKNGKLIEKQTITMLASDFKGKVGAADIHVSPDGKFLYASNRGDANELVIYAIDKNGKLNNVGRQETLGKVPRNFAIDPTGNYLLVANQSSNEVVIFKRDIKTGFISPTGNRIMVSKPVCLKFVAEN
jgi:6-phosphogluconolactonase